jgi:hypothetical protein
MRAVRRSDQWSDRQNLVVGTDQECGMNEPAIEASLHRDLLIRSYQLTLVTFTPGIDQRPARTISHDEFVAIDFSDTPADSDNAAR